MRIPASIARLDLSPGAKILYAYLCHLEFQKKGYPGHSQAADDLHTSDRSIQRWMRQLLQRKLVYRKRCTPNYPGDYHIPPPEDAERLA